jgi:hypothetical protein
MRLGARVYVTAQPDDEPAAIALRGEIGAALASLLEHGQLAGYRAVAVGSEEDWDEQDVDREAIDGATGGGLPIVYLAVSYDDDDPAQPGPDVGRVIKRFNLQPAYQIPPPAG